MLGIVIESSRVRIGDAERDDAATLLSDHLAAGRLDYEEFQQRTESVLAARTQGELDAVFDDLPGRRPGNAQAASSAWGGQVPARGVGQGWPQQPSVYTLWPAVFAVGVIAVCVAAVTLSWVAGGGALVPLLFFGMVRFGNHPRGGPRDRWR